MGRWGAVGQGPDAADLVQPLHGLLAAGLGIALLPAYSVVDDLRSGRLVQVLPGWRSPEIAIFALLPSGRFVDAKTRAWIDLLKRELPPAIERDMAYFGAL